MSSFELRCEHGGARARRRGTGELCWFHGAAMVGAVAVNCRPHCGVSLQRPLQVTQPVQEPRPLLISLQLTILQVLEILLPLTFPVSVPLFLPLQVQVGMWGISENRGALLLPMPHRLVASTEAAAGHVPPEVAHAPGPGPGPSHTPLGGGGAPGPGAPPHRKPRAWELSDVPLLLEWGGTPPTAFSLNA